MRKRPWLIAAPISVCCLLMVAAAFPVARTMVIGSPAAAKIIQLGGDDAGMPNPEESTEITLDAQNARGVLGSAVRSAADEDMGRIVDIIVDRAGAPRAAVIDFGGFFGVGSRKIAVDWSAIRFSGRRVTLDMTRDQLKSAPEYKADSKTIVVLGASAEFARSRVTERIPEQ